LLVLSLVMIAGLVYANAVDHPFVYDDRELILENPRIRSLSNVPEMIGFTAEGFQPKDRWTREFTHAIEYALAGLRSPVYHATNIGLHAVVGLLVFLLFSRVVGDRYVGWWAAALWLAHPIESDVVAQVSGRRDVLAALFALAFLAMMERYLRRGGAWRVGLALVLLYLGVFSKQVAIMAPPAVFLIDLYLRRTDGRSPRGLIAATRAALVERKAMYAILILATLVLGTMILWFTHTDLGVAGSPSVYSMMEGQEELGFVERMFTAGLGLRLALLPIGQACSYGYDSLEIASRGVFTPLGLVNMGLFVLAIAITAYGLWRRHWIGFAGGWFALFFFPTSGFVMPWHEVFAERFLYIPMMGFCLWVAALLVAMYRSPRLREMAPVAGVIVLVTLGAATHLRNRVWSSSEALWLDVLERYPRNAKAHKAVASLYLLENRTDLALEHYEMARTLIPSYKEAHVGVVAALSGLGEYGEALAEVDAVIERWPRHSRAHGLRGVVLQSVGRLEEAEEAFRKAVETDPELGSGYANMALLHVQLGNYDEAIEWYEKAVAEDPSQGMSYRRLEMLYREHKGNQEKADYYGRLAAELSD
jgi:Tfp pilus assembly protein PilF